MTKKTKYLIIGLILDGIGLLSYVLPVLGEGIDFVWAPVSALIMMLMYKGTMGKVGGAIELIEEGLPFTDFIPTYTLLWAYKFIWKKDAIEEADGNEGKLPKDKADDKIIDI